MEVDLPPNIKTSRKDMQNALDICSLTIYSLIGLILLTYGQV